jgi:hypothetical protein
VLAAGQRVRIVDGEGWDYYIVQDRSFAGHLARTMRASLSIEASHSNELFACNYQIQICEPRSEQENQHFQK